MFISLTATNQVKDTIENYYTNIPESRPFPRHFTTKQNKKGGKVLQKNPILIITINTFQMPTRSTRDITRVMTQDYETSQHLHSKSTVDAEHNIVKPRIEHLVQPYIEHYLMFAVVRCKWESENESKAQLHIFSNSLNIFSYRGEMDFTQMVKIHAKNHTAENCLLCVENCVLLRSVCNCACE